MPLPQQRYRPRRNGGSLCCRSRLRPAFAGRTGQWPPRCPVAWLVHEFNARVASHVDAPDPHDRRLGPDQFVVSLRHYRPTESELSRDRLKSALSTAEGLLLQPRGEGELIELSDDEAVAAAVMLPMIAADRLAPSASSHTGGAFKRNARGVI